ncbi:MAG: hypothetical protein E7668_06495 [Ruminococcaceae bacterium]|nr:hypothetical protein [Oscillospiraceae bacterium]
MHCVNSGEEIIDLTKVFDAADKTAASANMKVCGVYDASSDEYTEEIQRVSDHYIYDFSELLDL